MRWGTVATRIVLTVGVLGSAGVLGSCGGDNEYRRPEAEAGKVVTVVDADTPGVPKASTLEDIALGQDGTLFLAFRVEAPRRGDYDTGLILAVPAQGQPSVVADEEEQTFPDPLGFWPDALAVDPDSGTLYVADSRAQRIRAVAPGGRLSNVTEFGEGRIQGPPATDLHRAEHLVVDPTSGDLYMADTCQVARISGEDIRVILGTDGTQCRFPDGENPDPPPSKSPDTGVPALEAGTSSIAGLAVEAKTGRLFLVDNRGVFRLEEDGTLLRLAGEGDIPFRDGREVSPLDLDMEFSRGGPPPGGGIAVDPAGVLYLGAPFDGLVMRLTQEPASIRKVASVSDPRRLVLDNEGDLYVATSPRESSEATVILVRPRGG